MAGEEGVSPPALSCQRGSPLDSLCWGCRGPTGPTGPTRIGASNPEEEAAYWEMRGPGSPPSAGWGVKRRPAATMSPGPGVPDHSAFLFTPLGILLWLPLQSFLAPAALLGGEERGEMRLCRLVQPENRRPFLLWFLLLLLPGMTQAFSCHPFLGEEKLWGLCLG